MFLLDYLLNVDPIAFSLGPLDVRWYGLAYAVSALLVWGLARKLSGLPPRTVAPQHYDDLLIWIMIGLVLGGRIGYILFYDLDLFMADPIKIFYTWQGGMAFHGGLLGAALGGILYCRRYGQSALEVADVIATGAPIGLFFGRIANYINGEAFGRVTDVSWGVVFPYGGPYVRHPSQLYEAGLEGVLLFIIMMSLNASPKVRQTKGLLLGIFIMMYGIFRFIVEFFREPNSNLGYYFETLTMGQLLSAPMIVVGLFLMIYVSRGKNAAA